MGSRERLWTSAEGTDEPSDAIHDEKAIRTLPPGVGFRRFKQLRGAPEHG